MRGTTTAKPDNAGQDFACAGPDLPATSAVASAIMLASMPTITLPSTNVASGEATIRTMRMRKAENTRIFGRGGDGFTALYASAIEKPSASSHSWSERRSYRVNGG